MAAEAEHRFKSESVTGEGVLSFSELVPILLQKDHAIKYV